MGDKSCSDTQGKFQPQPILPLKEANPISLQLVTSNGMEVFSKYFRRLLTGNAPQIFPGVNKSVENAGNYQLLVQEMQKVSSDIEQSQKIAETVDTSEGDIFRDFDLSTFLDHFRLDPIVKVSLALAFKMTNKSDLRAKGKFMPPSFYLSNERTNLSASFQRMRSSPTLSIPFCTAYQPLPKQTRTSITLSLG